MGATISTRNDKSQDKIFLGEIVALEPLQIQCGMAKRKPPAPRDIFLGEWLKRAGIGPTEAAAIAGCTQSYITNMSSGARNNINVLYLLKLSEHMKINVNDFFQRPPAEAQVKAFAELSPEAQEMLLRPRQQKRR